MRLFLLSLLLFSNCGFAQTKWIGAVDADWNNPLNWDISPLNGDSLIIDPVNYSGSMQSPVISSFTLFAARCILIQNQGNLTVNDTLTLLEDLYVTTNGSLNSSHGTITVQNNMYVNSGGTINADSSIIDIGNSLYIADGANSISSSFSIHASELTIHEMLKYGNTFDNYFPVLEIIDGNIRLNGDLLIDGLIDNNGQARFKLQHSTAEIYGNITKNQTNPYSFFIEITDSSDFSYYGTAIYLSQNDSIVMSDNSFWKHSSIPDSPFSSVVFHIGKFKAFDSPTLFTNTPVTVEGDFQFHDLMIDSSGALGSIMHLKISGNFLYDGWFYSQLGLTMNGSDLQHIEGSADSLEVVWEFIMNNTGDGVVLGMDLHLYNFVDFIDGILFAPEGNEVYLHSVSLNLSDGNSFIQGYINSNTNFFPLGWENNRYRPLLFLDRTNSDWIRATYQINTPLTCVVNTPLTSIDTLEYWEILTSDSIEQYQLVAGWNDANQSGIGNFNNVTLAKANYADVNCEWNLVPSTIANFGITNGPSSGDLMTSFKLTGNQILTFGFTENLYQLDTSACQGFNWMINGSSYNENGTFIDTINADSVLMIHLAITPVDTQVNFDPTHIYAHASGDSCIFRWINCTTGQEIEGEHGSIYSPTENGSYAVIVKNLYGNYCEDTSVCIVINQIGIQENEQFACNLFPNPLHTEYPLHISSTELIAHIEFYDLNSQMIHKIKLNSASQFTIDTQLKTGIYYVKLITVNGHFVYKKLVIYK